MDILKACCVDVLKNKTQMLMSRVACAVMIAQAYGALDNILSATALVVMDCYERLDGNAIASECSEAVAKLFRCCRLRNLRGATVARASVLFDATTGCQGVAMVIASVAVAESSYLLRQMPDRLVTPEEWEEFNRTRAYPLLQEIRDYKDLLEALKSNGKITDRFQAEYPTLKTWEAVFELHQVVGSLCIRANEEMPPI